MAYGKTVSAGPANGLARHTPIKLHVLCLLCVSAIATNVDFDVSSLACNTKHLETFLQTSCFGVTECGIP